jgi:hypothetical protein
MVVTVSEGKFSKGPGHVPIPQRTRRRPGKNKHSRGS